MSICYKCGFPILHGNNAYAGITCLCKPLAEVEEIIKLRAEVRQLREAIECVLANFQASEAGNYRTSDRQFAIDILTKGLVK